MKLTNRQKRQMIILAFFLFVLAMIFLIIKNSKKEIDITNAIHGVITDNNIELKYKKNKVLNLAKGERVYLLEEDIVNQKYKVKYEDKVGTIDASAVSFFHFDENEKYSLMLDVSEFNEKNTFPSVNEFSIFILDHHINYVYIRLGGRGWGQKGNWYYDDESQGYIETCEYLGVPYGFYYLDEALNEEEMMEEVKLVKEFITENKTSMNLLPLAIDVEYQSGQGRADEIWEERATLLNQLIEKFEKEEIECIVYVNGNRANQYLKDLNADLWVARYLEDNMIPESFYPKTMQYLEMQRILKKLLEDDGKLKSNLQENMEYQMSYRDDFLDSVVGWQFSESGANEEGIEEVIDLSMVKNNYFKQYVHLAK